MEIFLVLFSKVGVESSILEESVLLTACCTCNHKKPRSWTTWPWGLPFSDAINLFVRFFFLWGAERMRGGEVGFLYDVVVRHRKNRSVCCPDVRPLIRIPHTTPSVHSSFFFLFSFSLPRTPLTISCRAANKCRPARHHFMPFFPSPDYVSRANPGVL